MGKALPNVSTILLRYCKMPQKPTTKQITLNNCIPTTANMNCNMWFMRKMLPIDFMEAKTHLTTYCNTNKQTGKKMLPKKNHYVTEPENHLSQSVVVYSCGTLCVKKK